jgi:hypothetical protein
LISYGVDLQMLVNGNTNSQSSLVTAARFSNGILWVDRRYVAQRTYLADNKSGREKLLVVEHPLRQGWTLVDSPKPYETTASLYRFEIPAPANKATALTIKEESVQTQQVAVLDGRLDQLLTYSKMGEIPANIRAVLEKAAQIMGAGEDIDRQIAAINKQQSEIDADQGRIRENMKTVGQMSQYYQRLLTKLNEQETSIEKLQRDREELRAKRDAARKALEDYLRGLTIG